MTATPAVAAPSPRDGRLVHHLYLFSSGAQPAEPQREAACTLLHVSARTCALALETLYPPRGRSGSTDEAYLIYEKWDELEQALRFAPRLDVPPADPADFAGESPFRAGVGLFHAMSERGPRLDRILMQACLERLDAAAESADADDTTRWAAAVLASRVLAEHAFDYAAARHRLDNASRLAPKYSLERLTALWWTAEAYRQEGDAAGAQRMYKLIAADGHSWPEAQVVRRTMQHLSADRKPR